MRLSLLFLLTFFMSSIHAQSVDFGSVGNNGQTARGDSVCDSPDIIRNDDGSVENGYSANPDIINLYTIVDRFNVADFPSRTIESICVGWVSLGPTDINFDIVVFDDDGAGGEPGTLLGSIPASATGIPSGLPGAIFDYDVTGASITLPSSGNFYMGVRFVPPGGIFVSADETDATNAGAGQQFFDSGDPGDAWEPINLQNTNYSAMVIRGLPGTVVLPESQPVPAMSAWALILMVLALAGFAAWSMRR